VTGRKPVPDAGSYFIHGEPSGLSTTTRERGPPHSAQRYSSVPRWLATNPTRLSSVGPPSCSDFTAAAIPAAAVLVRLEDYRGVRYDLRFSLVGLSRALARLLCADAAAPLSLAERIEVTLNGSLLLPGRPSKSRAVPRWSETRSSGVSPRFPDAVAARWPPWQVPSSLRIPRKPWGRATRDTSPAGSGRYSPFGARSFGRSYRGDRTDTGCPIQTFPRSSRGSILRPMGDPLIPS
jgi:hypothetical protein